MNVVILRAAYGGLYIQPCTVSLSPEKWGGASPDFEKSEISPKRIDSKILLFLFLNIETMLNRRISVSRYVLWVNFSKSDQ